LRNERNREFGSSPPAFEVAVKPSILSAAKTVLIRKGLADWTVDGVATEASCAKGLVTYHFKTKARLLAQVGASLREDRTRRRLAALRFAGATALDALWSTLVGEARSGEVAAWLALLALPDEEIRRAMSPTLEESVNLGIAAARALEVGEGDVGSLIDTVLTGFQIALLHGHDESTVREAYHRFWLSLL
jgi:AcrR family transcriptional regulator